MTVPDTDSLRTVTSRKNFGDFQDQFYDDGVFNHTSPYPFTYADWKERAELTLNPSITGYVSGGAGDEQTQDGNVAGLKRYGIVPRMLRDRSVRDMSVEFLGRRFDSPLMVCPVGVLGAVYPNGDLEVARAVCDTDVVGMYSTLSEATIEEVADARGTSFGMFQLYPTKDKELTASFVRRAQSAGFDALAVTVDTGTLGWRPRDLANGFVPMLQGQCLANYTSDPRFHSLAGVSSADDLTPHHAGAVWQSVFANPNFTWDDVRWLRSITDLPIVLKGICSPGDAARARSEGIDAIACSNHGGRQANGGLAAIDHLGDVVDAAGDVPVTFDSGIRDGVDILRAVALGASLVGIARPYVYALAVGGTNAIKHLISSMLAEADLTMAVDCYSNLGELSVRKVE